MKNNFIKKMNDLDIKNIGVSVRKLLSLDKEIYLLYISLIVDRKSISENIIKPILKYSDKGKLTIKKLAETVIYADEVEFDNDEEKIEHYLLEGKTIIVSPNEGDYLVVDVLKREKRNVESPEVETGIKAPRDAFTESIETNLSLIRYRIKDPALRMESMSIGRRTKTKVAVVYIEDIVNPDYLNQIKDQLNRIEIDGILESGYIQKYLSDRKKIFPQIGTSERSDSVAGKLLDGKVAIIVDGSNFALIAPRTFLEFLDSGDDHYENTYVSVFVSILRFIALLLTLTLSALYVTVVAYQPDILPSQYILSLANSRVAVPVNALLEALLMEFVVELLRESNTRLPRQIGPSIGIVGTIVIGQAAVSAGLVSPLMVIIVSLSSMASFALPDYALVNITRLLKFFMILCAGVFGLFGFIMGYTFLVVILVSTYSVGIPYTAPLAPFSLKDIKDFLLADIVTNKDRPRYINPKDKTRQ